MRDEGAVASLSSQEALVESRVWPADAHSLQGLDDAPNPSPAPSDLLPALLGNLGITPADIASARLAARINDTDLGRELVASGKARQEDLAGAMATALGLPAGAIPPGSHIVDDPARSPGRFSANPKVLRTCDAALRPRLFVAPALEEIDAVHRVLVRHPDCRALLHVATPRAIARHRAAASSLARSEAGHLGLAGSSPEHSAREVMTGAQGFITATLLASACVLAWHSPYGLLFALHLIAIPFFLAGILWRLSAALSFRQAPDPDRQGVRVMPPTPHPVYTVLVALHREAEMAPGLVAALAQLQWPRSRLEVMLVCEADDRETISAVEAAIADQPGFEIVLVPPSLPRTKPKALNVALPLASGEFLVLYDAEDRPHPAQLEAAWQTFRRAGPKLACLQAPLIIANGDRSWLSGHFALEYAALFRGFLPWLARQGLPLPLGGTSNHFRRAALVSVGAWDSHNVTEDADLGIRLARYGYAVGTIDVPTEEDGPERGSVWLKQRTRWMKGWMQTWLVHMRHPTRLWREIGPRGFGALQILFFGMIGSAFAHPLSLIFLVYTATSGRAATPLDFWLMAVDVTMLICGYAAYAALLFRSLTTDERKQFRPLFPTVYIYWLLVSLAVLRALAQLFYAPHRWEKTPHGAAAKAPRSDVEPVVGYLAAVSR